MKTFNVILSHNEYVEANGKEELIDVVHLPIQATDYDAAYRFAERLGNSLGYDGGYAEETP